MGVIEPVEGTPMDLRQPTRIGAQIDGAFSQLVFAGGYDHNWITADQEGSLHPAAQAFSPATGISMEVFSTLPGIQFYSGNYLDGCPVGKEGASYARRWGFCLETQMFPDTPNRPEFPSCVLRLEKSGSIPVYLNLASCEVLRSKQHREIPCPSICGNGP